MATIYGSINNDSLTNGTSGNDTFYTSLGGDYVQATAGNDSFVLGFAKSASYWKNTFNDFDTLDYRYAYNSYAFGSVTDVKISVDLQLGTIRKLDAAGALLNTDTVVGVDAIYGTQADDTIRGRDHWDYEEFRGYGGADLLDGRGGSDGVNYSHAQTAGIEVAMAAGTVTSSDTEVGTDTLRQIEIVTGTNFTDVYDATGYGGTSINKNSSGEGWNLFNPLGGDDTVTGNGDTTLNYGNSLGGSIVVDLSLLTAPGVEADVVTDFTDDPNSSAGITPGTLVASGVSGVRGGAYDDTLLGGGQVNTTGSATTLSGDASGESFRGNGGNDFIDGRSGYDRAGYSVGNMSQGITVNLAAGTVTGDPLLVGTDTLRGIEAIDSTYLDDLYDARGFTLTNAAAPSANSGDVFAVPLPGVMLANTAFNDFRVYAGNDTVLGNGATRISFSSMFVEQPTGPAPSVTVTFTGAAAGTASYGGTDGGFGTVVFTGTISAFGGSGADSMTGADGFQVLRGYFGNDTLAGGAGADALYGHNGGPGNAVNLSSLWSDDDRLDGGSGNDLLRGDFGNDILTGGTGNDTMEGGTGSDVYGVDATGDVVTELAGGGSDTINSSVSIGTLAANVEALTLTGSSALNATGNGLSNTIAGNAGANVLSGGSGNDTITGNAGADRITGGTGADVVVLNSKVGSDTLVGFTSGTDDVRVLQSTLRIGDGDKLVEGAIVRGGPGGFSAGAELVIFTANLAGLTAANAAAAIGSATSAYAIGRTALFAIDNGSSSALYLFTSSGANATVSAAELTLLATLSGTPATQIVDYVFG